MIKRILIVDDEETFLYGFTKALKKYCGFNGDIKAVERGQKAIDEVTSSFYDICFLDLNLLDMNGLDVMEKINRLSPGTKIVIVTAEIIDEDMKMKVEKGACLFIPKPVDLEDIRSFILEESGPGGGSAQEDGTGREHLEKDKEKDSKGQRETERRRHTRRACNEIAHCSVSIYYSWEMKSGLEALVMDVSDKGACISAKYPLYPGNVLKFDTFLENRSGLVKWSSKDGGNFRAGIRFL